MQTLTMTLRAPITLLSATFSLFMPRIIFSLLICLGFAVPASAQILNVEGSKADAVDMPWLNIDKEEDTPAVVVAKKKNVAAKKESVATLKAVSTEDNLQLGATAYRRRQTDQLRLRALQEQEPQARELLTLWADLSGLKDMSVAEVNLAINQFKDPLWAMRLRRDWILEAFKRGEWKEVITWSKDLDSPNQSHQCALVMANIKVNAAQASTILANDGLPLWRDFAKSLGKEFYACTLLQEALWRTDLLTPLEKACQVRRLLFVHSRTELLGHDLQGEERDLDGLLTINPMPLPANFSAADFLLVAAHLKSRALSIVDNWQQVEPQQKTNARDYQEWMVAVVAALADQDPEGAGILYLKMAQWLSPSAQATAQTFIGLSYSANLSTQSAPWLERVQLAELWSYQQEQILRSMLRQELWQSLRQRIEQADPELRRSETWRYWWARALLGKNSMATAEQIRTALQVSLPSSSVDKQPLAFAAQTMSDLSTASDFYGALASEWLGRPIHIPPFASPSTDAERQAAENNECLAWASKLIQWGGTVRVFGVAKWRDCIKTMDDRQLLAASVVAASRGILDRSINTAIMTEKQHDWRLRFITPFADYIKPYADMRKIPWPWVYGLMRQESRFLIDAHSSSGAKGLMQIMPKTGAWLAKKEKLENFNLEALNDTDTNVRLGTLYLEYLYERFNHPVLVTAAYNAGPSRAQRWRPLGGSMEAAIYAETIPFTETRGYVKNVLWNTTIYEAINGKANAKISDWLPPVTAKSLSVSDLP